MDLSLSFFAGFLTGLHCVGMCGGIVACYAVQRGSGHVLAGLPSHLSYNGGRLLSYGFLGALAGLLGETVASLKLAGPWFSLGAGMLMVLLGLLMFDFLPGLDFREPDNPSWLRRLHLRGVANLLRDRSPEGAFYVGLLTPLLPCGMLYAMVLKAAESGSASMGAMTMIAFATGTVPALLLTGIITSYVSVRLRFHATRLAAVVVVVMGIILIVRGVGTLM